MLRNPVFPTTVFLTACCALAAQTPAAPPSEAAQQEVQETARSRASEEALTAQVQAQMAQLEQQVQQTIRESLVHAQQDAGQVRARLAQVQQQAGRQVQDRMAQIQRQMEQGVQERLAQAQTLLAQAPAPAPAAAPAGPPESPDSIVQMFTGSGSYLGVGVEEIGSARAKELKLKEERGVEIRRVEPDSPAEKAGLKEHDVVLEYNGQRVEGVESFTRMVRETPAGRAARLVISRDGNTQTLSATIGRRRGAQVRPFTFTMPAIPPIDIPKPVMAMRTGRLGLEIESLSGQLADYFGVREGALVRSVEKDSPADKAGVKAGDVILKVGGATVVTTRDVSEALRENRDKKAIPVQVMRSKKEMSLNLEIPDRSRSENRDRARTVRFHQERL